MERTDSAGNSAGASPVDSDSAGDSAGDLSVIADSAGDSAGDLSVIADSAGDSAGDLSVVVGSAGDSASTGILLFSTRLRGSLCSFALRAGPALPPPDSLVDDIADCSMGT
ncbi:unnamed protein product [Phytophthora fragariaefolia]|uniref:Unnamed protein product n=1 Tax=Phytophthora fragariaefolia TaxID=1490495 RepID=A0A9W6XTE3_9STRA|nr:unnamed protein product [Phytophthora fragariaefolia]